MQFLLNLSITKDVGSSRLEAADIRLTKPCWHVDIRDKHKCCK